MVATYLNCTLDDTIKSVDIFTKKSGIRFCLTDGEHYLLNPSLISTDDVLLNIGKISQVRLHPSTYLGQIN